jgi:proteasome lid subunit RPN8/RPN11
MSNIPLTASITKEAYEQLIALCLKARPIEACGILASSTPPDEDSAAAQTTVDLIIPITNIHINPTYEFSFSPVEWTSAIYELQKNRQSLVGLFHSHPKADASPSSHDTAGFLPASGLTYWIVSLQNPSSPQVQPYRSLQGAFQSIALEICQP